MYDILRNGINQNINHINEIIETSSMIAPIQSENMPNLEFNYYEKFSVSYFKNRNTNIHKIRLRRHQLGAAKIRKKFYIKNNNFENVDNNLINEFKAKANQPLSNSVFDSFIGYIRILTAETINYKIKEWFEYNLLNNIRFDKNDIPHFNHLLDELIELENNDNEDFLMLGLIVDDLKNIKRNLICSNLYENFIFSNKERKYFELKFEKELFDKIDNSRKNTLKNLPKLTPTKEGVNFNNNSKNMYYEDNGFIDEAYFISTKRIENSNIKSKDDYVNRANILIKLGKYIDAADDLAKALEIKWEDSLNNLRENLLKLISRKPLSLFEVNIELNNYIDMLSKTCFK